uniref:Uncharacterized mitochondrial protein AtMg00810-like n=1 Tax=Nicotiana tabacum TaxID=4097 RepID=A0A1S3YZ86_TOBAC|nr:PREDICTED: uncharacterized mitochondrial protein AtMg00810-like [Nicotiana tabacum]
MTVVRALINTAVKKGWDLHQLDVNNAFLHGDLHEEVYMEIPQGLKGESSVFVVVYVDDVILTGTNLEEIKVLKTYLHNQFKTKDLGELHYFLGLEMFYKDDRVLISQMKFTTDLMKEYDCLRYYAISYPLDSSTKLRAEEGPLLSDPSYYRKLVGKLNFLTNTRLDIAYNAFFCPLIPLAYCDSDWAAYPDSRKSVNGYLVLFGGSPISWKSKKQTTVSLSFAEADYISLRKVVVKLAVVHIARNSVFHERTKHIEVNCHFVQDKLHDGLITLHHISTHDQLADILTKAHTGI